MRLFTILMLLLCFACNSDEVDTEIVFNQEQWNTLDGTDYPYRAAMLNDVVYNDTIRDLSKNELLNLLGEPSYYREDPNYLHYTITRSKLGPLTLHTKVMVVKCTESDSVDWIKIYE